MIKAIFVATGDGTLPRKGLEALSEVVKDRGGDGVAFFKVKDGAPSGGIAKFMAPEDIRLLGERAQSGGDGIWLFVAHLQEDTCHACADGLRRHLGEKLGLTAGGGYRFVWVQGLPLLEWDGEEGRFLCQAPSLLCSLGRRRGMCFFGATPMMLGP